MIHAGKRVCGPTSATPVKLDTIYVHRIILSGAKLRYVNHPAFLSIRGLQLAESYRYLTPLSYGGFQAAVLPNDRAFTDFQSSSAKKISIESDPYIQAETDD